MIFCILIITVLYLIYKWGISTFDYFEKKGVKFNKPHFLVGSRLEMVLGQGSIVDFVMKLYNEFKSEKISGYFEFRHPTFIVRDVELIKQLTIKDFEFFPDHRTVIDENVESLFSNTLFGMKGQTWRGGQENF